MNNKIRVAVVGVGNCAKSLIEGVHLYQDREFTLGLAFQNIGGYEAADIRFVLAYDIDERKVGQPLYDAIDASPNCAKQLDGDTRDYWLLDDYTSICNFADCIVQMGYIGDGVAPHMLTHPDEDRTFRIARDAKEPTMEDVVRDLQENNVHVLLNYLPVGSQKATEFYIEACLKAGVPFVNCIPVFICSNPEWQKRIKDAGIPAIGDDMRSQLGASVLSQALQELFMDRGVEVDFHEQLNHGGNTDFLNMMDQTRLASKKVSKENVIRSQVELRGVDIMPDSIYAGPSTYVPYHGDQKVAHIRIEGRGFGNFPITLDAKLVVEDSPNSAGVVIDAIRYVQTARELGYTGVLYGPSAATQKTPPRQMRFKSALEKCRSLAMGEYPMDDGEDDDLEMIL